MFMNGTTEKRKPTLETAFKKIQLKDQDPELAAKIQKSFKLHPVTARVLSARGFKDNLKIEQFLNPTLQTGLPHPNELLNLDKALSLVKEVRENKQKIAICCDFDVDGLTGGAQLHLFFESLAIQSKVFVPDRFSDGYGLNQQMIEVIAKDGYTLLITIDYGTTNITELNLAKKLGVKTIVIDHHHVGDINNPADVFINPNQSNCGFAEQVLAASGLAWYFIAGAKNVFKNQKIDAKSYLDLACLGTICDMVPLIGANRVIAKRGLECLAQSKKPGIQGLKNAMGIGTKDSLSCYDVSFGMGPRINAAGRLVHGDLVIELLTTQDSIQASKLSKKLNKLNQDRQDLEEQVKIKAIQQLQSVSPPPTGIVVWDKAFHTGVIGIVAQRLVEKFYRPAIVLGKDEEGIFKGSVRGISGFNVIEALTSIKDILIKFGGHEGAGGLSIQEANLPLLRKQFHQYCSTLLDVRELAPVAKADTEVKLHELSIDLISELQSLSPFGIGNPAPQLLTDNLEVIDLKVIKNAHTKVLFSDGKHFVSGMLWRTNSHPEIYKGNKVNIVFKPEASTFNGITEVLANIQAVTNCN